MVGGSSIPRALSMGPEKLQDADRPEGGDLSLSGLGSERRFSKVGGGRKVCHPGRV